MFPYFSLFGKEFIVYDICFALALMTIPVMFFSLRKTFGFTKPRTLFYTVFTLGFGLLSAWITAVIKNAALVWASNGEFEPTEWLRNYGIPMFLPIFFLLYCLFCRDQFRTLMDYLAPGVYSVMSFVKLGCMLNSCCYGEPDEHGIMNVKLGYRTFPVQLYDMVTSICIVIICIILIYTLRKKHKGFIYPIGGMLFALTKGFWENYRVHTNVWERNFLDTGWTFWQFWMTILFVGCFVWLILAIVWEKKGIPDFDVMPNLKLPDCSFERFQAKYKSWKTKRNNYTHHNKKKK